MAMSVKVSGTWKSIPYPRVKVSGSWKHVQNIYTRVSGAWKPLYSYWFDVGGWGSCSASCGGGTQTRTVQCKRTGDVSCDDSFCTRAGLTVPARSQACNTQGCTVCYAKSYNFGIDTAFAHSGHRVGSGDDVEYWCGTRWYYNTYIYKDRNKLYEVGTYTTSVSVGGYTYTQSGTVEQFGMDSSICAFDLCITPN